LPPGLWRWRIGLEHSAAPTEVERSIGAAMADAAVMIHVGVEDWKARDGLRDTTRRLAGERLARVCMLHLEHNGCDFGGVARREGRRELWKRNDAAFRTHYGTAMRR
jgi:hypothetical protein